MDLTKILKPGDSVYSLIHAKTMKIKAIEPDATLPIKLGNFSFNKQGSPIPGGQDCLLFPSDIEMSWDNYSPFLIGDIVLVYDHKSEEKHVRVYSHKENGKYYVVNYIDYNNELGFELYDNCEYMTKLFAGKKITT